MKYRLRHILEYVGLRAITVIFQYLPERAALALGWGLARVGYYALHGRVREAQQRLRQVLGPEIPQGKLQRIAWLAWRNLCFNAIDAIRIPRFTRKWAERAVKCEGVEKIMDYMRQSHKGVIVAIPHMGSWEVAAIAAQKLYGLRMLTIVRRQKNPLTDRYLDYLRSCTGVTTIPSNSTMLRKVVLRLQRGEVLPILPDVRGRRKALSVRYLGQQANLAPGMAYFAQQAGVPVFPTMIIRTGWTRHYWRVFDPVRPEPGADPQKEQAEIMQKVMDIFTDIIRQHPEQYFWFNRRWVLQPMNGSG